MSAKRNYGIDLLRLVLMYMICMLHTLGQGGILALCDYSTPGQKAYLLVEFLCFCAVDSFAVISGYMSSDRPTKYEKIVEMWLQVFFYSFIVTLIAMALKITDWDVSVLRYTALPVIHNCFWYFTAFFALFFAMPIINRYLSMLDETKAARGFIITFVLFSVFSMFGDSFGLAGGYLFVWLTALYCMGGFARRMHLFEKRKTVTLAVLWLLCIAAAGVLYLFFGKYIAFSYTFPTIVLAGIILVVLFSRINIKGTVVKVLSPLAFGIYLFQLNTVIWGKLKDAFTFVFYKRTAVGLPLIFVLALGIFLSGLIVEFIRSRLFKLLHIQVLCKFTVRVCARAVDLIKKILV